MSDSEAPVKAAPKSSSSSSTGGALVPIKEETVEFTAGIIGGITGLIIGGPLLAAIGAATANYISKMDGEATDVVQAVSKSSIQVYNYLSTLDSKYEVLSKAKAQLEKALNSLKSQDTVDPEAVEKVEKALASTSSKIKEINDEYDLVGAGTTALGVVGDLVEKAVKKAGELNEEYQLTQKATESLEKAISKAKAAAKDVNLP
jgi:methyl-accepting chemotaxis protein